MSSKFTIYKATTESPKDRPPISDSVNDYLAAFIFDEVLKKKKIIVNAKWDVMLVMYFIGEGQFGPHSIVLGKGSRTVNSENKKIYEMLIPIRLIEAENKKFKTIQVLFEAVSLFLVANFKTITTDFMSEVWKKIDLKYLMSLSYPAPIEEQNYVGDEFSKF